MYAIHFDAFVPGSTLADFSLIFAQFRILDYVFFKISIIFSFNVLHHRQLLIIHHTIPSQSIFEPIPRPMRHINCQYDNLLNFYFGFEAFETQAWIESRRIPHQLSFIFLI